MLIRYRKRYTSIQQHHESLETYLLWEEQTRVIQEQMLMKAAKQSAFFLPRSALQVHIKFALTRDDWELQVSFLRLLV